MAVKVVFFDLGETLVTSPRHWLPGAKDLLKGLRLKGLKLGIISNTTGLTTRAAIMNQLPTDFDLTLFETNLVLFSTEVGKEKPKKEIFEMAVTRSGKPANECLYVSENIVETLMTQQVGMRSIRVQTAPNNDLSVIQQRIADYQSQI